MRQTPPTVAIIGAGINGAALARELALSGVHVVVIESQDIGCGATAWSTRLVHGGLRYLEYGEIDLVRESLRERERLVRLAGHLVEPLPFYIPLQKRSGGLFAAAARLVGAGRLARWLAAGRPRGSWAVGIGLWLYDLLSGGEWPRHSMHRGGASGQPEVDIRRYPRGASYVDAQMRFPERFTVELLQDAQNVATTNGTQFHVHTHVELTADSDGTLHLTPNAAAEAAGVTSRISLRPDAIVNASGAWVDRTRASVPLAAGGPPLIGGTKGSHLVIDAADLRRRLHDSGVYAEAGDGRPMFVLPFGERLVLVGTTDLPYDGDPADAIASDEEITYLLSCCQQLFPDASPTRENVLLHYCGVRPLPNAGSGLTPAAVTRRHLLLRHPSTAVPSWSIVGGKLTTCRSLAETAAAEVLPAIDWSVRGNSQSRPLPGAAAADTPQARCELREHLQRCGVASDTAVRLVQLYGGQAEAVAGPAGSVGTAGCGVTVEAVRRAVAREWAVTLDDVVSRRLMLAFEPDFDLATLRQIAEILASTGRLAEDRVEAEVAAVAAMLERRHGRQLAASVAGDGDCS